LWLAVHGAVGRDSLSRRQLGCWSPFSGPRATICSSSSGHVKVQTKCRANAGLFASRSAGTREQSAGCTCQRAIFADRLSGLSPLAARACRAYRRDAGLWRRGWRVAAGSNVGRGATHVGAWASAHENDEANTLALGKCWPLRPCLLNSYVSSACALLGRPAQLHGRALHYPMP
jgi:hypothetical protein